MVHKAFWVHNADADLDTTKSTQFNSETKMKDPLLVQKDEKIAQNNSANMKLVQQYVMINGRLQPALKYIK